MHAKASVPTFKEMLRHLVLPLFYAVLSSICLNSYKFCSRCKPAASLGSGLATLTKTIHVKLRRLLNVRLVSRRIVRFYPPRITGRKTANITLCTCQAKMQMWDRLS